VKASSYRVASRHAQWLWLGAALEGVKLRLAAQAPHFQAVFFMGLPGAGKGYVKGRRYLKHTGFFDIDPDEIKKTHPDYNPEDPSASRIHEWSSLEAARQFQDALKTGASFILDGTGTNPTKLITKMAQAKEANFRVFLVNVHVSDIAGLTCSRDFGRTTQSFDVLSGLVYNETTDRRTPWEKMTLRPARPPSLPR